MELELVTRQGCHLCEHALAVLRAMGLEPRLCDVDADPELLARYDFRVPVLLAGGRVVAEGRIERVTLQRVLGRLRRSGDGP